MENLSLFLYSPSRLLYINNREREREKKMLLPQESLWFSTVSSGDTYVEKSKGFFTTSALKVSKCGPSRANASLGLCANHKNSLLQEVI